MGGPSMGPPGGELLENQKLPGCWITALLASLTSAKNKCVHVRPTVCDQELCNERLHFINTLDHTWDFVGVPSVPGTSAGRPPKLSPWVLSSLPTLYVQSQEKGWVLSIRGLGVCMGRVGCGGKLCFISTWGLSNAYHTHRKGSVVNVTLDKTTRTMSK